VLYKTQDKVSQHSGSILAIKPTLILPRQTFYCSEDAFEDYLENIKIDKNEYDVDSKSMELYN